jgi:glycosyltransferase involved in cell wall biosynthesis
MTSTEPLQLSILLPVYNGMQWLEEAVDSVLFQSYPHWELLAIDDGSTDGSKEVLDRYAAGDDRIRVLSHPNWGMGASLNHAIEEASHDWLVRMDADDVMLPHRLERQVAFIQANPDVGVASCLVEYIDGTGNVIGKYTSELTTREAYIQQRDANVLIGFHHPGVIMRRDLVREVGGYRPEYWSADDLDLWNRIAELDTMILVQPEYLMQYRVHGSSVSHAKARDQHLKVRWVRHNMLARRAGSPELSLDTFIEQQEGGSWLQRANRHRQESGMIYYKSATLHYSSGDKPRTLLKLAAATLMNPTYTAREVNKKFLHIRLPGIPRKGRPPRSENNARAGSSR